MRSTNALVSPHDDISPLSIQMNWRLRVFPQVILMIVLVAVMVLPFLWMFSTSLKAQQYILETPPRLIPNPLRQRQNG